MDTVTLVFKPGRLGLMLDWQKGVVESVVSGRQGESLGVKEGWQLYRLGEKSYTQDLLRRLVAGTERYSIAFVVAH